jgi:geranyl diphosphate 2-C-methyltransferase
VPTTARLLDAGSGRGGTSLMAHERFGCRVDGVTISEYQVDFANHQAAVRGMADAVRFHFRHMLDTGFEVGSMRGIWTNETTMYVDLFELYAEFARLLEYGGRYVCITGCYNDVTGGRSKAVPRRQLPLPAHRRRPDLTVEHPLGVGLSGARRTAG